MNSKKSTNSTAPRLITIAISNFCEKVRFALDWLSIEYIEESHTPPFHRFYTRRLGGKTVPVLVTEAGTFVDSTDILYYLDGIASVDKKLYPNNRQLRQEVEKLEELFDTQLAVACRCWGYYYALKNPMQIQKAWGIGVSEIEKIGGAIAFPFMRRFVQQVYNTTPEGAASSLQKIREIFNLINQYLEPNQKYLIGDNFSAADLTFAALASPVLRPENHPIYSSFGIQGLPHEMVEVIQELRETPAGKFALRLYREHRR